jgi:hypothetical protein
MSKPNKYVVSPTQRRNKENADEMMENLDSFVKDKLKS